MRGIGVQIVVTGRLRAVLTILDTVSLPVMSCVISVKIRGGWGLVRREKRRLKPLKKGGVLLWGKR